VSALVELRPRDLSLRLCAAPGCDQEAEPGRDVCRRHLVLNVDLGALATAARDAHAAVAAAVAEAVEHGIRCGEALLEAHRAVRADASMRWREWLAENVGISDRHAYGYMRLAYHRDRLPEEAFQPFLDGRGRRRQPTVARAVDLAVGLGPISDKAAHWRVADDVRDRAVELREQGLTYRQIGARLGIHFQTVSRICNPEQQQRHRDGVNRRHRDQRARQRAAEKAQDAALIQDGLAVAPDLRVALQAAETLVGALVAFDADPSLRYALRSARIARAAVETKLRDLAAEATR